MTGTSRALYRHGFWAYPPGELVVRVRTRHVHALLRHPRTFGFADAGDIRHCYLRHGEKPGIENRARGQLIRRVVEAGWLRIRRYPKKRYYTFNCPDFSDIVAGFVGRLFRDLVRGVTLDPGGEVLVETDPEFRVRVDVPGLEESWFTVPDLAGLADPKAPPLRWVEERVL